MYYRLKRSASLTRQNLLPQLDLGPARLRLADDNGLGLDCFRFATLDYFFGMAERVGLPVAA